ncbi:nicotinamide N-methyltransferase-like [Pecten maximus]|uniref:nicotinamide N-methyltransferase-like n=1 Tax=Pecten maximus TaxID=6579 RepID=UPI0014584F8E|nr:nicotinamide N-methyltransferase-like [Pecten maximus]XP_033728467.1 nicotinamide N-methyltransferase-like [Pecten maximus]
MEDRPQTEDYAKFDPEWYLDNYIGTEEASINMRLDLNIYHRFFSQNPIRGKRLLDVGTGPSIHTVISASNHVDEIFLSDYTSQNRQYLEKWRSGKIDHPKMMIDYVSSLDGRTVTAEEREKEIRQKVKGIVPIDVTSQQPLGSDYDGAPFDIIVTSYCFEAAVSNVAEYKSCIENVSTLLKKGGYLVLAACLEGGLYQVGEYNYRTINISRKQIDSAMAETGYKTIAAEEIQGTAVDAQLQDFSSYYFIVGSKC